MDLPRNTLCCIALAAALGMVAATNSLPVQAQTQRSPVLGPECHPSYALVCVPFASDVDCAGGAGNGPAYVRGPVQVVGTDEYELDRDGDGFACEPVD
jgi:hypothetical protein